MWRKFFWVGVFVCVLLLIFLGGYRLNRIIENKDIEEISSNVEINNSLPLNVDTAWEKKIVGKYGELEVEVIIKFDRGLCGRRSWCGFEEYKGTFEDVANTVAYAINKLNGEVGANMMFDKNGRYTPILDGHEQKSYFDLKRPVVFVFYNGDSHVFPARSQGFSRGWGVDPNTNGLIIFIGNELEQSKSFVSLGILEVLNMMMGIKKASNVYDKKSLNEIYNIWTNSNVDLENMAQINWGVLKVIEKSE